jgi:hypothetical protein
MSPEWTEEHRILWDRLLAHARLLPESHLRAVVAVAERAAEGVDRYGPKVQPRNWAAEAREECLDAVFYLTWALAGEPER